jgi:hypothetical protein
VSYSSVVFFSKLLGFVALFRHIARLVAYIASTINITVSIPKPQQQQQQQTTTTTTTTNNNSTASAQHRLDDVFGRGASMAAPFARYEEERMRWHAARRRQHTTEVERQQ